jgi:hypothetical protein
MVDTIARKLFRSGSAKNKVALKTGIDDLHNNFLVGKADNKAVFGCIAVVFEVIF